ncbi:hypothetical protein TorRG33x02_028600 [Trema orientale]|uniref:Uncharacterized protein n=1 Tax=Trema orientale TaxID=63057 RepID=A0A2P5FUU0_TREOI|nr:hypothetical protein TorRG33x02_028600 [Trema orientale]
MKTSAKDSKVSKLPIQKPSPCASSKISKSSTLGGSDSKRNQITQPVLHTAGNIQKNSGLKGSSNNTRNALNNSKAGPVGKSLNTKTSLGQAKRNVANSVKGSSTNLKLPLKTEVNNDLGVIPNPSLPPTGFSSNVHDGESSKTAVPLPKSACRTGVNIQPTQLKTAKPSGLRMPSPSLGFFGQSKAPPLHSPVKMTSQACNVPDSNISNLRKFGGPPNPVLELRPPLAPGSLPEINRDGSFTGNFKASRPSSECPVLPAVSPALHEIVESNSQVDMQIEKTVKCNDTHYEAIKTQKELQSTFVGMDQKSPWKAGQHTTTSITSMEDIKLQRNEDSPLRMDTLNQLDKYDIDTKVVHGKKKNTKKSEPENPQLTSPSSSAIEVTGLSAKNDITHQQLAEDRPCYSLLKDHGDSSELNTGQCNVNEPFGEQAETMTSVTCVAGPISSGSQVLRDNAADMTLQVQDYNAAEIENSHTISPFRSTELEKDYGVPSELNSVKCNVDETFGKQTKMMNSVTCETGPISSDSQMLRGSTADMSLKVQDYNAAEVVNSHTFSPSRSIEVGKEVYGVSSGLNSHKCNVEPFGEQAETCEACPIFSDSQLLQDNAADISSKVQDYNAAEIENSHNISPLRSTELEKDYGFSSELNSGKCIVNEPLGEQAEMMNSVTCETGPISINSKMLRDNAADMSLKGQDYNAAEIENSLTFSSFRSIELGKEDYGVSSELNSQKCNVKPFGEQAETLVFSNFEACPFSCDSQMLEDNATDTSSKVHDYNASEINNSHTASPLRSIEQEKEDSLTVDVVRKQSYVEDAGAQSFDGNVTTESSNNNISIFVNNQHKMVVDNVIEKPEFLEFPKSPLSREDPLEDVVLFQVDDCLIGNNNFFPEEPKQENVLHSDEAEGTEACESELKSSSTPLLPVAMLDCRSKAAKEVQCHTLDDIPSVDSKPVVANFNPNAHFQHDVGLHDQSTSLELGNMDEDHLTDVTSAEEVNVTGQKSGSFSDSEQGNPYITSEPSLVVQVEDDSWISHTTEHDDVEDDKINLSVESSCHIPNSQPEDDFCPCNEDSSMGQIYTLEGESNDKVQEDQVQQITPCLSEIERISNKEKESSEAPGLSTEHSNSLEELQIFKNGSSGNVHLEVGDHKGTGSESPGLSLHEDMAQEFKESEGGNYIIKEQDENSKLRNPVNQIEEASSANVPEHEDVKKEHKRSGIDKKQDVLVIKPPLNATPFSDEWLAAFEAAGEEILTMKSGAVQNSPPEKAQPEPGPWSPVKRKHNQGIGPYDCTKYNNTNP